MYDFESSLPAISNPQTPPGKTGPRQRKAFPLPVCQPFDWQKRRTVFSAPSARPFQSDISPQPSCMIGRAACRPFQTRKRPPARLGLRQCKAFSLPVCQPLTGKNAGLCSQPRQRRPPQSDISPQPSCMIGRAACRPFQTRKRPPARLGLRQCKAFSLPVCQPLTGKNAGLCSQPRQRRPPQSDLVPSFYRSDTESPAAGLTQPSRPQRA